MSDKLNVGDKVTFRNGTTEYTVLAETTTTRGQYVFLDAPVNGRPASVEAKHCQKVKEKFIVGRVYKSVYYPSPKRYIVLETSEDGNRAIVKFIATDGLLSGGTIYPRSNYAEV